MRDVNNNGNIHVEGDFNVTDKSNNEHKLIIHCSNEELLQERPFRQENIKIEQKKKVKRLKPFYGITVALIVAAAGWALYKGQSDIVTYLLGAGSLFLGFQSLRMTIEPNKFQREEQYVVNEITKILKQRRVE